MVSANLRRLLVGVAAIAADLGWLQLAPAFGFPVTAPVGMLDRMLGATREAGPAGWALLLLGQAAFAGLAFVVIERQTRRGLGSFAFAVGAWFISGAVLMPLIGLIQGAGPAGAAANDPMRANFFMLNLGLGAAAEALVGWLLFGAAIAAGLTLKVTPRAFTLAAGAAAVAAVIAFAVPALGAQVGSGRVVEGPLAALPAGPVFISVLELPQPAGAVLGPHQHIAGFVVDVAGTASLVIGANVVDVGPGDAVFTADQQPHDHENRAAVPFAIALALVVVGLSVALVLLKGRGPAVALMAALLVAGSVATVNPLMNHWYFIGVRPAAQRGAVMPVPAGHRTYESENLAGLGQAPYLERLTDRRLGTGESVRVVGPAAIVVLDGQASVVVNGLTTRSSAQSGTTIAGGAEATVKSESGSARVLVVQLLPAS
jgi:quercetin dioxygenase-like cupin family protein